MIKLFVQIAALILISSYAIAGEISEADTGTYAILGRDNAPIDMYYRLSKSSDKWVMAGKKPGDTWKNISCDSGCDYSKASDGEIKTYFPADLRAKVDIVCIKNIAQAFCRYSPKGDSAKSAYVAIALVTGKPIPIFIRRVNSQ